jgi:hypothetical protein
MAETSPDKSEHADMVAAQVQAAKEHRAEAARMASFRRPRPANGVDSPPKA